jgi:hypothetical protein
MHSPRDHQLLDIAHEVMRVYWGSSKTQRMGSCLSVELPVLDGEVEIEVRVRGGVFTVRSQLPGMGEHDLSAVNRLNSEMEEAAFCYVLEDKHLWLQSKLAVPDLRLEHMRPPALRLAWQAGWNAACGKSEAHSGPSSYDQFVFIADLMASMISQQWHAQQGAASILLEED